MKINPARIIIAPQISTLLTGANAFAFSASTINLPPAVNNSGADSSPPQDTGIVEIKDLFYSGTGAGQPDEYVVIRNEASFPIQLNNWTLSDAKDHISTFAGFVIQPDQVCRVDTNPNMLNGSASIMAVVQQLGTRQEILLTCVIHMGP